MIHGLHCNIPTCNNMPPVRIGRSGIGMACNGRRCYPVDLHSSQHMNMMPLCLLSCTRGLNPTYCTSFYRAVLAVRLSSD